MRINEKMLEQTQDIPLLGMFKRGIVLETKDSGNGQSPYDLGQLEEEILKRMGKSATAAGQEIHQIHVTTTADHVV